MSRGISLNDADRIPWLLKIKKEINTAINGDPEEANSMVVVVVACSALKRTYRNILLRGESDEFRMQQDSKVEISKQNSSSTVKMVFVLLECSYNILNQRLQTRQSHFMKSDLLLSQLETLEKPDAQEKNCMIVDAEKPVSQIVECIWRSLPKYVKVS